MASAKLATINKSAQPDRPDNVPDSDVPLTIELNGENTAWYDPATGIVDDYEMPLGISALRVTKGKV